MDFAYDNLTYNISKWGITYKDDWFYLKMTLLGTVKKYKNFLVQ